MFKLTNRNNISAKFVNAIDLEHCAALEILPSVIKKYFPYEGNL